MLLKHAQMLALDDVLAAGTLVSCCFDGLEMFLTFKPACLIEQLHRTDGLLASQRISFGVVCSSLVV